jgi:hypothetical protein
MRSGITYNHSIYKSSTTPPPLPPLPQPRRSESVPQNAALLVGSISVLRKYLRRDPTSDFFPSVIVRLFFNADSRVLPIQCLTGHRNFFLWRVQFMDFVKSKIYQFCARKIDGICAKYIYRFCKEYNFGVLWRVKFISFVRVKFMEFVQSTFIDFVKNAICGFCREYKIYQLCARKIYGFFEKYTYRFCKECNLSIL